MREDRDLLVGLDIGTSKVTCLVARLREDGGVEPIGLGVAPMTGMKRGAVVNIEASVAAIAQAVDEAKRMAACDIPRVHASISGAHIQCTNAEGMLAVKGSEITREDVVKVIEVARAMPIPSEQQVLHLLTQEFIIDGQGGIKDPVGMSGVKLVAKVHIITGAAASAQNIIKCVRRAGLEIDGLVLQPLAAAHAVLTEDEKSLGVCIIDIGAGTTDLAVYTQGAIRHTAVLPAAGDMITNDIAMALRTPTAEAESIKLEHGAARHDWVDPEEMIEVAPVGDRPARRLSRQRLADVIHPRAEEIFELVQQELRRSGYEEMLSSGVVLTGGSAKLGGMVELAEEVLGMPARLGAPLVGGRLRERLADPEYAAAVGLVLEAADSRRRIPGRGGRASGGQWWRRTWQWIRENF